MALLKSGSRGDEVKKLQLALTSAGYNTNGTDGIFGNNTRSALINYQKANGLGADGIAGDKTYGKLYAPKVTQKVSSPVIKTSSPVQKAVTPVQKVSTPKVTTPVQTPVSTIPSFNAKTYIDGVVKSGNTGIDEAQKARDAIINARLQEQTSLQAGQEREVNNNLAKNTETIQGDTYEAQETQRATGVQRGIQYSQQQQGLEQGISRAGTKLIVDAKKERDTAILNIRDRIASLKNGASLDKQASASQASSEKAKLLADATDQATKRQWGIDDMRANQAREDVVIKKNFDNQVKAMNIDHANKVALANLDFEHQKVFMALTNAQQTKIAQMNNSAQMAQTLAQIRSQQSIASANRNAQARSEANALRAQQASQASAERQKQIEVAGNFMLNDPKFNTLNNADKARYFDLIGMPKDIQAKVFAEPPKSASALSLIAKYAGHR